MTTDPDQIRAEIDALLAQLPDVSDIESGAENEPSLADLEQMADRISQLTSLRLRYPTRRVALVKQWRIQEKIPLRAGESVQAAKPDS